MTRPTVFFATAVPLAEPGRSNVSRLADELGVTLLESPPLDASIGGCLTSRTEELARGGIWHKRLGLSHAILIDVSPESVDHPFVDFVAGYAVASGRLVARVGQVEPVNAKSEPTLWGATEGALKARGLEFYDRHARWVAVASALSHVAQRLTEQHSAG